MKKLISYIFVITLLLPSFIALDHLIDDHHEICEDTSIHFHKNELDCFSCDFIRNLNTSFFLNSKLDHSNLKFQFGINFTDKFELSTQYTSSYFSRGPPSSYFI